MRFRPAAARAAAAQLAAALWLALGTNACEHPQPVVPPPPPPAPPPPPPARVDTPLPLPPDLVFAARWSEPAALLRQVQGWAGGELSLELWLRGRVGRPSRPVDLQAPIEFFALWNGKSEPPALRWAVSFALATANPADVPRDPRTVESPIGLSCAEAHALGSVPLRMVCSGSDEDLQELLPAATRAVPLAPLGSGKLSSIFHAEPLRAVADDTLQARTRAWLETALGLQSLNERGNAQLAGIAHELSDELRNIADDFDGAQIELAPKADEKQLELSIVAPRAAARSELMQLLIGTGAAGIAPADFWQLQLGSEDAGYLWAFNAVPLARLRAPFSALLGTLLDFRGLPERLQQQGSWLIEHLPMPMGPIVHAAGHLPASGAARGAPAPWLAEIGWQAFGFAGRFSAFDNWTDQLASAFNDPILGPQFGRLVRSAWGARWVPQHIKRRQLLAAPGLPKGSFLLELAFASAREEQPATAADAPAEGHRHAAHPGTPTLYVLFVPDPDGVKIAWAADEKFLLSLAANPARRPLSATLAARGGLGVLHEQRTLMGGFSSLAAFANGPAERWGLGAQLVSAVDVAPHRGLSPILYRVSQQAELPVLSINASLGRETLEDLLFLIADEAPHP